MKDPNESTERAEETPDADQGQEPGQQPPKASPNEQQNYDRVVLAGMQIMYGDQTHEAVMDSLRAAADTPADALAHTMALIISQLEDKAQQGLPQNVVMPAAKELLAQLVQLADKAGVIKFDKAVAQEALKKTIYAIAHDYGGRERRKQNAPAGQQPATPPAGAGEGAAQPPPPAAGAPNSGGGLINRASGMMGGA